MTERCFRSISVMRIRLMVQNKDYYITNMTCYVDVNVDITKLPKYAKSIKQTSAILRGSILGMVEKN